VKGIFELSRITAAQMARKKVRGKWCICNSKVFLRKERRGKSREGSIIYISQGQGKEGTSS